MSDTAIQAEGLSKAYEIGELVTFRKVARKLRGKSKSDSANGDELFWALRDVSFELKRGQVLGIIGGNGAGKSTLLKILAKITAPTRGHALIRGRVGSLLEVGTGFHPELTGRENVYLNGTILGMKKREIDDKFDEIVSFAEVERFIDTPVKRYSSGMRVRLAFAVAAHLEPEVLICDEVLAVGDLTFQRKCLGKMQGLASAEERTILFVSHNMDSVSKLCQRALFLEHGAPVMLGETDEVISRYVRSNDVLDDTIQSERYWDENDAIGIEPFRLRSIRLFDESGELASSFRPTEPVHVQIGYELAEPITGMRVSLRILSDDGVIVFTTTDQDSRTDPVSERGLHYTNCYIPANLFNNTRYTIQLSAGVPGERHLLELTKLLHFRVDGPLARGTMRPGKWPGLVCPPIDWKVETANGLRSSLDAQATPNTNSLSL